MDDDTQERGDEIPRWPPFGSPQWRESMRGLHRDLRNIQIDAQLIVNDINKAVDQIFKDFRP